MGEIFYGTLSTYILYSSLWGFMLFLVLEGGARGERTPRASSVPDCFTIPALRVLMACSEQFPFLLSVLRDVHFSFPLSLLSQYFEPRLKRIDQSITRNTVCQ